MWLLLLLLTLPTAHYRHHGKAFLPDSLVTPGAVLTTDTAVICRSGYATRQRRVDSVAIAHLRGPVYRAYGTVPGVTRYQLDHSIPIELGGASVIGNVWRQPDTPTSGAHAKDQLENRLHRRVCAGTLALTVAQRAIARDWYAAAKRYP